MARWLIILGVVLAVADPARAWSPARHILVERENFRLYLPITTSILISILLSVLLWFLNR